MSHAFKEELPEERIGDYGGRTGEMGEYYVKFESFPAGFDDRELLKGLPDDACHAAHWGYVLEGRIRFRYLDGTEETIEAGEAYYAPPGHTFEALERAETVEFSPKEELDQTTDVVVQNLGRAGALS